MNSNKKIARIAGVLYLIYIIMFASSTFMPQNIFAQEELFRIRNAMELISTVFFLSAAWALYVLLKPVNKNFALLFVLLNLVGVAAECVCILIHYAALIPIHGGEYLKALSQEQLRALSMLMLNIDGNVVMVLFYGLWLFPLGYLVFKSGFLPKILGILLIADGCSLLICFFQLWLFPGYEKMTYPLYPIMFAAEFGLSLWLIIKGVKDQPVQAV
ncbi:MAG: DUF4386 domain-containing protein [Ignavibacteriaceae bacterium]